MLRAYALRNDLLSDTQTDFSDGDVSQVTGIVQPGDCALTYIFRKNSDKQPDGGIVLPSFGGGIWELLHNGTGDFRWFGIFDSDTPADAALESMVNCPEIREIRAFTPLNFQKRHKFFRSGLTIDFQGNTITARGIEDAPHNDPFSAVMHFCGKKAAQAMSLVLTAPLPEQYDIFEVPGSADFPLYSWWQVSCNALSGREEKEIDKLLMVTEIVDNTHVRFNYKMGWSLKTGRVLFYRPVEPVTGIAVKNMEFEGNFGGEACGAQPLAYEFAVDCDAINLHAKHTYWPVILRRHNTGYLTSRCSLINPVEVVVGGTGYLTQQIHCLYGSVRDCTTSNARHLNDFTGSAYCAVENCHGDGDFHGAFVTHGQFEHDLSYTGNSGLLSFANSGPTWGSSAKRITVTRHVGCWGLAFAKVSDLTLQDVTIYKTEKYSHCGTLLLNADGLQVRGCRADKLVLTQRSSRSQRPCVIENCYLKDGLEIVKTGDAPVTNPILALNNTEGKPYDE